MKNAICVTVGLYSTVFCGAPALAAPSAVDIIAEAYDKRPASVAYPLEQLVREADSLIARMKELAGSVPNQMRYECLLSQLTAVRGNADRLAGKKMTFDEESLALFGTVAPPERVNTDSLLKLMDSILPGAGNITVRLDSLRSHLIVPSTQVDTVMRTAMNEVRRRTLEFVDLPAYESISLEYVTDKS
jgi:hypothetical protein